MKVILVRPPETNRIWCGIPRFFNDDIFLFPPLGIMQLKAYIEKYTAHQVTVYDCLMRESVYSQIAEYIKHASAQVVGISTFTHSLIDVVETAQAIKKINPSVHIVLGGPHTYTFHEESIDLMRLGCIDYIILGDGEEKFKFLLNAIENNTSCESIEGIIYRNDRGEIVKNGSPTVIEDIDDIPFPSRDIHGIENYFTPASHGKKMTTMITSRGCPFNCKFCDTQSKYRARSVKNVVDEMEICCNKGFEEIFFIDDTFNISVDRVVELSEEIIRRGLKVKWGGKVRCDNVSPDMLRLAKKAGCVRLHYGVETGVNTGLDSIDKKVTLEKVEYAFKETKKAGIRTVAYFIIGCPHEKNITDVMDTINFSQKLPSDFAVFSLLSPYPDTTFYKKGVDQGILNPDGWKKLIRDPRADIDYELPTAWTENFTKDELLHLLRTAHRKFYYRPIKVLMTLCDSHSITELMRLIKGGLSLLKLEFGIKRKIDV